MEFKQDWRYFQWEVVKAIANNSVARAAVLIPLAGYLILFNDEIATFISFNTIAGVEGEMDSPFFLTGLSKVRLVFFGSMSIFVANIVYRAFRPPVLDATESDIDFSTRVAEAYSVHEIAAMDREVHSDKWTPRTEAFWIILGKPRARKTVVAGYRPDARKQMFSDYADYIHLLSREWWRGRMNQFRIARMLTLLLAALGYLFLALPTLDITQAVVRDILSNLM